MNGILLSIVSGVMFGLFQALNRRAGRQGDVYLATFILLLVSSIVLIPVAFIFEDIALLRTMSGLAVLYFSLAALIHFFIGWTLFSMSQKRVGAARTSVLLGTVPVWATAIGLLFFDEFLTLMTFIGIMIIIAGAFIVSSGGTTRADSMIEVGWRASLPGLGTAVCFAGSSIFIRYGLEQLPSPLLGVTIGMVVVTLLSGMTLLIRSQSGEALPESRFFGTNLWLQIIAGGFGCGRHLVALDRARLDPDRGRHFTQSAQHTDGAADLPVLGRPTAGKRSTAGSGWVQPSY